MGEWGSPICEIYHCHAQAKYRPFVYIEGGLSTLLSMCDNHYFIHMNTVWGRERHEKSV